MRKRQNGITFIGWLFLLVPVAIIGYAAIRLTPVYLNYTKVARSLEQIAADNEGESQLNATAVRIALEKRFDIESINFPEVKQIEVGRDGQDWVLRANYEEVVPLFSNVSLLVKFDKRAVVK